MPLPPVEEDGSLTEPPAIEFTKVLDTKPFSLTGSESIYGFDDNWLWLRLHPPLLNIDHLVTTGFIYCFIFHCIGKLVITGFI